MRVALCGIAKLENHYIREWVEWYLKIGVDKIFLYDNNDVNGERFEDVIGDYIDCGFVEVIDYRGKRVCQLEAYDSCYERHNKEYDWIAFLDIDEFLKIDRIPFERNIKSFLGQTIFDKFNAVKVSWKCMTDGDLVCVENGNYSVIDRFKDYADPNNWQNRYSKCIVRGGISTIKYKVSVHYPEGIKNSICDVLGRGAKAKNKFQKPIWTKAVLMHYKFKTIEEYVTNKMQRLYPDHKDIDSKNLLTLDLFFDYNKRTKEKEDMANELLKQYQ